MYLLFVCVSKLLLLSPVRTGTPEVDSAKDNHDITIMTRVLSGPAILEQSKAEVVIQFVEPSETSGRATSRRSHVR